MSHLKVLITLLCKATLGLVRLLVKSYQAPHPGRYGISAPLQHSLAGLFVSLSLSSFLFVGGFGFFFSLGPTGSFLDLNPHVRAWLQAHTHLWICWQGLWFFAAMVCITPSHLHSFHSHSTLCIVTSHSHSSPFCVSMNLQDCLFSPLWPHNTFYANKNEG